MCYNCKVNLKYTKYFLYTRQREDRKIIKDEWIERVIREPIRIERQKDGRIRKWGYIEEVGKCLRVIILEDGQTVHNAFFDRSFKIGEET